MQVQIRQFKNGDQQLIQELITRIMDLEFPQSKAAYPMNDLLDLQQAYGEPGEAFFVATNGKRVIGTVAIKKEDGRIALLRRVFVDPEHRRQKIGLALIKYAINFCRENGYEEIVFRTSSKMDGAIKLCQKEGFQQRAKLEVGGLELLKFVLFLAPSLSHR
ncbi:MAG: GNAT family N-acetyltransferase [Candidatus Omnitrophica bacterium]|nr:GNAT family N-acetyltransferase [Candidatus Omnitrophota bacterium]